MTITVEIDCHTENDAESALDEIKRLVSEGFHSGSNQNETGRFTFETTGSPVEYYRLKRNGKLLKKQYNTYDEVKHCLDAKPNDKVILFDDQNYQLGEA
jgi:hypothetical protein